MYSMMEFLEGQVELANMKIFKVVDDQGKQKFYSIKKVSF